MRDDVNTLGVYYAGATIADSRILEKVRTSHVHASVALGLPLPTHEKLGECHITLLPPFFATYEDASELNLAFALSTINSNHPLTIAKFRLGKMSRMTFAQVAVLYYEVNVLQDENSATSFMSYITTLRQKVGQFERFKWRDSIPPKFHPHITVLSTPDMEYEGLDGGILWNQEIFNIVQEQRAQTSKLEFMVGYPTLYAKYNHTGWQPISQDPTRSLK